ncbi:MAG: histone deacetylase [Chloroflexi bacterium]|nr:histone deacetylase [Chloroflexota bacterium]
MVEVLLVRHPDYRRHLTGEHPERPARLAAIDAALERAQFDERVADLDAAALVPATAVEDILRVHSRSHLNRIERMAARGGGFLDSDTVVSPESYRVALLAAGGACAAVDAVIGGHARTAFALVRPPGHHATPDRAMGFCLLNNLAIAVRRAQAVHRQHRVAIVDFDVHHGNGTQAVFEEDPSVLFVSLHQHPLYPGSGLAHEIGRGPGTGRTINVPLSAGTGDRGYALAFDEIVGPALTAFAPELIGVSAGFDAHWADPLAFMNVTCAGFAGLVARLRRWAATLAGGRLVLVLEGGYNLDALAGSVVACVQALIGEQPVDPLGRPPGTDTEPSLDATLAEVRRRHTSAEY